MKKIILPITFILLLFAFGGIASATSSHEINEAALRRFLKGEVPVKRIHINYGRSLHPYWNEELEIDGGVIRLHKSVHNTFYFNQSRRQILERGHAAPYEERLLKTKEGDYEKYYKTELKSEMLTPFIGELENTDFYNMKSLRCDHEIWRIEVEIDGAEKVVSTVVLKDLPGFENLLAALEPLIDNVREHEVDEDEFNSSELN